MPVAAGVFLACLLHDIPSSSSTMLPSSPVASSFSAESSAWTLFRRFAPAVALFAGLLFSSYPEKHADWTTWSHALELVGRRVFYSGNEMSRDWSSVGALFIMLGALYSSTVQSALGNRVLVWMGKVSFAVFLLHSMLIRSILCWMLHYGTKPLKIRKEDGTLTFGYLQHRQGLAMWISIAVFFTVLYACAWLWYLYVENWCGRMCQKMEDALFEKEVGRPGKSELPR